MPAKKTMQRRILSATDMTKWAIYYTVTLALLIPAQAIIFDHMILFHVAVPLVFLTLIISLPVTLGTNLSMFLGFVSGFLLDMFCDTPGVNSLCCTVLSFVRKPVFHLYVSIDDDLAGRSPSSRSMGHAAYMKYMLTMTAFYCLIFFSVEAMQLYNFKLLIMRIVASTVYTFICLYALDCLRLRPGES